MAQWMPPTETTEPARAAIAALADACVKCGLCLPHCPTYRVSAREGQSPRGRIAFADALARGVPISDGLNAQLDDCIGCLSCERVCPANVRFDALLVGTRALPEVRARAPRWRQAMRWLLAHPRAFALAARAGRIGSRLGIGRGLAALSPPLARLNAALVALPPQALDARRPSAGGGIDRGADAAGSVVILSGCVGSALERDTIDDARRVVQSLGANAIVIDDACCGTLANHSGDADAAAAIRARGGARLAAFADRPWLSLASGCTRAWRETAAAAGAAARIDSVVAWAVDRLGTRALPITAAQAAAFGPTAWLVPCTQRHDDHGAAERTLIARLGALDITPLPEQPTCCGAGGAWFADHAQTADALADERIDQLLAIGATTLVASNIGCRLHLGARLAARGVKVRIVHPISVLARILTAESKP